MPLVFEALHTLLTAAHLLSNALAGGGLFVAALMPLWTRDEAHRRRLAVASAWALGVGLLTGGLGVSIVLADGDQSYEAAAARIPLGSYGMLATEWAFTATLLGVYLGLWRTLRGRPVVHSLIALVAATNFLYHFPTMMIVVGRLADEPRAAGQTMVTREVFRAVIRDPNLLAKTFHYWALAVLSAGVAMMLTARGKPRHGGTIVALVGAGAMFVTGAPLVANTPPIEARLLGGLENPAGAAFWAGLVVGVWLLLLLVRSASGVASTRRAIGVAVLVALATVLMTAAVTATRHSTRGGALGALATSETTEWLPE